jgi:hypothetical protein
MRIYEIDHSGVQALAVIFKTLIGRSKSKSQPAKFNWQGINTLLQKTNQEPLDYETFDAVYNSSQLIQSLVHDYNSDGIELDVPGAPDSDSKQAKTDSEKAQDNVNKTAASAAMNNISS